MSITRTRRSRRAPARAVFFAALTALTCAAKAQTDPPKPPAKAVQCAACHGNNGIGAGPTFPNLAGQKSFYLAKALRDYKAGKRQDEVMSLMAKDLKDEEIEQIAAYYESLPAGK